MAPAELVTRLVSRHPSAAARRVRAGASLAAVLLGVVGACVTVPPDDGVYATTWYVDPDGGSDANDGLTPATALRTAAALASRYPAPDTLIAFKRGTVNRLPSTLLLKGGTSAGWVAYGAYGDVASPKPILAGSVAVPAGAWSRVGVTSEWTLDWSPYIDTADGRGELGVEQGPGNLWFFDGGSPTARMIGWGWRKSAPAAVAVTGDWYYDAPARAIRLRWESEAPPASTEASINRPCATYRGQSYVIAEDLDLRYCGGYGFAGHESRYVRLRDVDISFSGGGTKNGSYVRLGNGVEVSGNAEALVVERCRVHQVFDTGFDPQNVGAVAVIQRDLTYRDSLVSYPGLAGLELWARPVGSSLEAVQFTGNTFLNVGRGWGFEQHDHPGQAQIGAGIAVFSNDATGQGISITENVFANPRVVLMSEWQSAQTRTKDLVRGLTLDRNVWYLPDQGSLGAVLFLGTIGPDGVPELGGSFVYSTLASWQASAEAPGKDASSVARSSPPFVDPLDDATQDSAWIFDPATSAEERPTRFGPFALRGDYTRLP